MLRWVTSNWILLLLGGREWFLITKIQCIRWYFLYVWWALKLFTLKAYIFQDAWKEIFPWKDHLTSFAQMTKHCLHLHPFLVQLSTNIWKWHPRKKPVQVLMHPLIVCVNKSSKVLFIWQQKDFKIQFWSNLYDLWKCIDQSMCFSYSYKRFWSLKLNRNPKLEEN